MSDDEDVVETLYSEHHKFEIIKKSSIITSPKYYLHKDGEPYRGSFSGLDDAVDAAHEEGAE